jgi:hypothetical protein
MWFFRSFPQENEKNNRATLTGHKLISVALKGLFQNPAVGGIMILKKVPIVSALNGMNFGPLLGFLGDGSPESCFESAYFHFSLCGFYRFGLYRVIRSGGDPFL